MTDAQIGITLTLAITIIGWLLLYRAALKKEGAQEAQHEENRKRIADLEKTIAEKVATVLFKEAITEIHGRISRMQSEQAAALKDQGLKIDKLLGKVEFLSGKIQMWATMKGLPGGSDDHE